MIHSFLYLLITISMVPIWAFGYDIEFTCDANHRLTLYKTPNAESQKISQFQKKVTDLYRRKYPSNSASNCRPKSNGTLTKIAPSPECTLTYFRDTPYMYVTGRRLDSAALSTRPVQCGDLDQFIENAVLSGQDPNAALAISLMENGTDINDLYLDPIGVVNGLGCQATRSSQGDSNFESFKTYYKVDFKTQVKNDELSQEIYKTFNARAKELNINLKIQKAYMCSKHTTITFETQKKINQCCVETHFYPEYKTAAKANSDDWDAPLSANDAKNKHTELASKILTFKTLKNKYLYNDLAPEYKNLSADEKLAFRAQSYNGYALFSGSGENMPMWRSGVNFQKSPAYGYQAMDFMLNSIMTNPVLQNKIKLAEQKYDRKSSSFLCVDRGPGQYKISSDYYFNKSKTSPRMESVAAKWKANNNINYSALAAHEQRVLKKEFEILCTYEKPQQVLKDLQGYEEFKKNCGQPRKQFSFYMKKILPLRNTVEKASQMEHGFSWNAMNNQKVDELARRMVEEW